MTSPNPKTENTEQGIQNLSFDQDFDVLAFEALGFDGTNLIRLAVDEDGNLQIA